MELSEQVFKVIFDNFNGIVIVHNYEGEILLLNDAARKKLFSKAKIKSVKNIKDLLNPENADHFVYYQHQLLVKKKFEGRYHFTNYKFEKLADSLKPLANKIKSPTFIPSLKSNSPGSFTSPKIFT